MNTKKRPTIVDVAERAGVSKSLVSLVLQGSDKVSDSNREAVLNAVRELGYQRNAMARSLARQKSGVLGCVISDLHNPFFADVADGVDEEALDLGFRALMSAAYLEPDREANAVETFIQLRAEGLLMLGPLIDAGLLATLAGEVPVVILGRTSSDDGVDSVKNNDSKGARLAVEHLADLGHRRIAHIDGGSGAGSRGRANGYRKAMRDRGLGPEIRIAGGEYTEAGGREGMRELLDEEPVPTAVFVSNDYAALGALDEITRAGLSSPNDISVVGYDDSLIAHAPGLGLTTVRQPAAEMGRRAVRLLIDRIENGRTESRNIVVEPELVVRDSTAPRNL